MCARADVPDAEVKVAFREKVFPNSTRIDVASVTHFRKWTKAGLRKFCRVLIKTRVDKGRFWILQEWFWKTDSEFHRRLWYTWLDLNAVFFQSEIGR